MLDYNNSVFIEARTWFDKTYGNTYFSARLWVNGVVVHQIPMMYGYGSAWNFVAKRWLIDNDYLPDTAYYANHKQVYQDHGIVIYECVSETNKSQMFEALNEMENQNG